MSQDFGAFQREHLRQLADKPNTTVLTVEHDSVNKPWSVDRLRPVMEKIVERVLAFDDDVNDFCVRKTCLDDPEILEFQRRHPQLYWMISDRKVMREPRLRNTMNAMLELRAKVERGELSEGTDADAAATQTVVAALSDA